MEDVLPHENGYVICSPFVQVRYVYLPFLRAMYIVSNDAYTCTFENSAWHEGTHDIFAFQDLLEDHPRICERVAVE